MIRTSMTIVAALMLSMASVAHDSGAPPSAKGAAAASRPTTADNKALAREIIDAVWNRKNPEAAAKLLAPDYVEHLASAADPSFKGFVDTTKALLAQYPNASATIHKLVGEGDFVAAYIHWKPVPDQPGFATADFFQFRDGKLIAHWGIAEAVATGAPAKKNPKSMF